MYTHEIERVTKRYGHDTIVGTCRDHDRYCKFRN